MVHAIIMMMQLDIYNLAEPYLLKIWHSALNTWKENTVTLMDIVFT